MDLALNNLQRLICHKTQQINQPTNQPEEIDCSPLEQSPSMRNRMVGKNSRL